ncbi:MAG: alpha/beta fold hydrolase [Rhodocyclaceae bacterium]|nr:alpha/beta fold hydrolase [Rhodocyclaceae bacterium]
MRADSVGVVLLHGKWSQPPHPHAPLAQALAAAGHRVMNPELPWSLKRLYDAPFEAALAEIGAAVAHLRQAGYPRVALAGHSLGACAALAAARCVAVDGVVVMAPAHFPERLAAEGHTTASLAAARQATATGDTRRLAVVDVNQGAPRRLKVRPDIYLSYFDPAGPACWPANARRLPARLPHLWLVGAEDPARALGMDYAFGHTPAGPQRRYLEIPGGHPDTPGLAAPLILDWLSHLPPP